MPSRREICSEPVRVLNHSKKKSKALEGTLLLMVLKAVSG